MLVAFTVTHLCFADYGTKAQRYLARETEVGYVQSLFNNDNLTEIR